jgi:tRNA-dihydrouridine synthase
VLARRLEEAGVELVTVHGRTTVMKFSGAARLDGIAEVVAAVRRIPVIGNGDVRTPADVVHMMNYTKCAGVMIGRGALSMPWIFRDAAALLRGDPPPPAPSIAAKCQLMRDHFDNLCRFENERVAVIEFRKRVSWYAKQMNPCGILRDRVRVIDSAADFDGAVRAFLEWRTQYDEDVQRGKQQPQELAEVA